MKKVLINILLLGASGLVVYFTYQSIQNDIDFVAEGEKRYQFTKEVLSDIRTLQEAYYEKYDAYTTGMDTLLNFARNDSMPIVSISGSLSDEHIDQGMTEEEAIKRGIIKQTITYVPVLEHVDVVKNLNYPDNLDDLRYVPFSDKRETLTMATGVILKGDTSQKALTRVIKVFAITLHDSVILRDMDPQLVKNKVLEKIAYEKYPGIRLGSLEEVTDNNISGDF